MSSLYIAEQPTSTSILIRYSCEETGTDFDEVDRMKIAKPTPIVSMPVPEKKCQRISSTGYAVAKIPEFRHRSAKEQAIWNRINQLTPVESRCFPRSLDDITVRNFINAKQQSNIASLYARKLISHDDLAHLPKEYVPKSIWPVAPPSTPVTLKENPFRGPKVMGVKTPLFEKSSIMMRGNRSIKVYSFCVTSQKKKERVSTKQRLLKKIRKIWGRVRKVFQSLRCFSFTN